MNRTDLAGFQPDQPCRGTVVRLVPLKTSDFKGIATGFWLDFNWNLTGIWLKGRIALLMGSP